MKHDLRMLYVTEGVNKVSIGYICTGCGETFALGTCNLSASGKRVLPATKKRGAPKGSWAAKKAKKHGEVSDGTEE